MTSKLTITDDKLSALLSEMERSFTGCQGHGYTDAAEEYIDMISALRELQERRKAEQDSEPVAHVDPHCVHNIIWTDYGVALENIGVGAPLFSAPQPALNEVSIFEAAINECRKCDSIDEHAWNHGVLAVISKFEGCRSSMHVESTKDGE
ncbi:TPA: hypothetical protein ACTW8Y_000480 [Raoultella ornithinolytica]